MPAIPRGRRLPPLAGRFPQRVQTLAREAQIVELADRFHRCLSVTGEGGLFDAKAVDQPAHEVEHSADHDRIPDAVSIRERPASVEDRAVPGHWEGDLISGSSNSHIATLVERHSRYVRVIKVADKSTGTVVSALIEQASILPSELYKSLTWDRGKERTDHKRFTLATDIAVYFCDPQSPWQRGSIPMFTWEIGTSRRKAAWG